MNSLYLPTAGQAIGEVREAFIINGRVTSGQVRKIIARAWERCMKLGVDPRAGKSPRKISETELGARLERHEMLLQAATPFMESLFQFVRSSGFTVMLADADSYILKVIGAESVDARSLGYLTPGAIWQEKEAGNTAIGTALIEGMPVQIWAEEHYCEDLHPWTCSAAPVKDPDGRVVGVLGMSGSREMVHCHTLGMVVAASSAIENQMAMDQAAKELNTANKFKTAIVESISDGLLTIDNRGYVTYINAAGARILKVDQQEIIGRHVQDIVGFRPVILDVLTTGEGYVDREFFFRNQNGSFHIVKTAVPIRDGNGEIVGVVDAFREAKRVRQMVNQMTGAQANFTFESFVGENQEIKEVLRLARIAASSSSNVLIQGESGTGKEILAQAIHTGSTRNEGGFVAVNCAAIPRELMESELFGHEEGAFTGARRGGRPGKFELANGGTIFLDEIGDMPLDMQVKLLRVIQERRVERLGGSNYIDVNVRVIAATNRDLLAEVQEGNFRRDLYYRLNVLLISVAPLRQRVDDLTLLVEHIIGKLNGKLGKSVRGVTPEVMERFRGYSWPGNVRELENVLERAMNVSQGNLINIECLPRTIWNAKAQPETIQQGVVTIDEMERLAISRTMEAMRGNIAGAARALNISRNTLYNKIRKYGL